MSGYLYEKDQTAMKYAILVSTRHARVVREISRLLRIPVQRTRRVLIEDLDMILLENLPARYQAAVQQADPADRVAVELGKDVLTRAVPIVDPGAMERAIRHARDLIDGGMAEERAIEAAREMLRGKVLP